MFYSFQNQSEWSTTFIIYTFTTLQCHIIVVISNSAVNIVELVHVAKIKPHRLAINKYNITAVATQNTVK